MSFFIASQMAIGPFIFSTSLLYILIGLGAGSIFIPVITKNDKASGKLSADIITNFLLIAILTWKLLPVLLNPGDIISNPISILYSSGGSVGIILGVGIGIVYLGIKLFLHGKHPAGNRHACSLRGVFKPVFGFFVTAAFVSSSLFFVSWLVRNGDSDLINGKKNTTNRIPTVGDMAPFFGLMNIDGDIISLDDYKGKWVILNFWATWCPPCKAELPTLNRFYESLDKNRVVLLGINATGTEKNTGKCEDIACYISTFVMDEGINFPVLLDFCDNTGICVSTIYGIGNLPTTLVISPEGIITQIKKGVVDSFWLRSAVSGN
jgi:peroxiredoxin